MMKRTDGRKSDEIRPAVITPNFSLFAEGSALIDMGNTRVLCTATIQEGVPNWMRFESIPGGWITGEYAMLPRASHKRSPREISGLRGRTQEIRRLIGRSLRAAVNLEHLGERTCIIDCDVLQADGGTRTAAITGGYVALVSALKRHIRAGLISEDVLRYQIAAISVGVVDGIPLLDLNYEEDHQADVDANVVMTNHGEFIEIQSSAEGKTFSKETIDELIKLAYKGIEELMVVQDHALKD